MRKDEAEKAIRYLIGEWRRDQPASNLNAQSFYSFRDWLNERGHGHYLTFKSRAGPLFDAELWFDQETKQTWKR